MASEQSTACPDGDPTRVEHLQALADLAHRLWERFEEKGQVDTSVLAECIRVKRCLLQPDQTGDANRCSDLAVLLTLLYERAGDISLLLEAITLNRRALSLLRDGSPQMASVCGNLASSLSAYYNQTGNTALLDEAIELDRYALQLRYVGHPCRADSCINLAASLRARYASTGDVALLDEAISLSREALGLRTRGHSDRAALCGNLASSLIELLRYTEDAALLLDEAIELEREALALRFIGHPDRAQSCSNLADTLTIHFESTGTVDSLDEAISLGREALALRPAGHPARRQSCINLAVSLSRRYLQTGHTQLLDESILLDREALLLVPRGHPDYANVCWNLSEALFLRFKDTEDVAVLDEAIHLGRAVLSLRPSYINSTTSTSAYKQPVRDNVRYCTHLADLLLSRCRLDRDITLEKEASYLYHDVLDFAPPGEPGRYAALVGLADLHLEPTFQQYSIERGIEYLQDAVGFSAESFLDVQSTFELARLIELADGHQVPDHLHKSFLRCFQVIIDHSSLFTAFALGHSSRLKLQSRCVDLGSRALSRAELEGELELGLQLFEGARDLMWSQALLVRDQRFRDLPSDVASDLRRLMRSLTNRDSFSAIAHVVSRKGAIVTEQIGQDRDRYCVQQLCRQIRSLHGMEDLMCGLSYDTLSQVAVSHPVVVLVAARNACRALVLQAGRTLASILLPKIKPDELKEMSPCPLTKLARGVPKRDNDKPMDCLLALARLWRDVVRPVIDHLGLEVLYTILWINHNAKYASIESRRTFPSTYSLVLNRIILFGPNSCRRNIRCCWKGVLLRLLRLLLYSDSSCPSSCTEICRPIPHGGFKSSNHQCRYTSRDVFAVPTQRRGRDPHCGQCQRSS
jgi:tetratricopeptide (TPR) repeat protein